MALQSAECQNSLLNKLNICSFVFSHYFVATMVFDFGWSCLIDGWLDGMEFEGGPGAPTCLLSLSIGFLNIVEQFSFFFAVPSVCTYTQVLRPYQMERPHLSIAYDLPPSQVNTPSNKTRNYSGEAKKETIQEYQLSQGINIHKHKLMSEHDQVHLQS